MPMPEPTAEQRARIARLCEQLRALDIWERVDAAELFSGEIPLDQELAIHERIANNCENVLAEMGELTREQREEVCWLVRVGTVRPPAAGARVSEVLEHYAPRTITLSQVQYVLQWLRWTVV